MTDPGEVSSFWKIETTPRSNGCTSDQGHRLSYQSHKLRDEHWVVVSGVAKVTLDDETREFRYGEHVYIKRGVKHRLACEGPEPVEIIEVQTGEAFPEEDIVRYVDDYDRA